MSKSQIMTLIFPGFNPIQFLKPQTAKFTVMQKFTQDSYTCITPPFINPKIF